MRERLWVGGEGRRNKVLSIQKTTFLGVRGIKGLVKKELIIRAFSFLVK